MSNLCNRPLLKFFSDCSSVNNITAPVRQPRRTPVYLLLGPPGDDSVGGQLDLQASLLTGLEQWFWLAASLKRVLTPRFWFG